MPPRARLPVLASATLLTTLLLAGAGSASDGRGTPLPGTDAGVATPRVAEPAADPRLSATDAAVRALAAHVPRSSHENALRDAFRAYFSYRHANPDRVRKPYLYFVDMGLDNGTPRGWVFDMDRLELVDGPFHVSHGRGSLSSRDGVPERFSNVPGSYQTSLGLYLAEETYNFRGTSSGGSYTSVGLRMRGESGRFNDAARMRGIVAHGAPYVSAGSAGRSEGCPAMEQHRARRLLPMLADGGVVFIYSPRDLARLASDPWVAAAAQAP
jgi:hypothetical protein